MICADFILPVGLLQSCGRAELIPLAGLGGFPFLIADLPAGGGFIGLKLTGLIRRWFGGFCRCKETGDG
jgi:hypothetical protein